MSWYLGLSLGQQAGTCSTVVMVPGWAAVLAVVAAAAPRAVSKAIEARAKG